ncbi:MAG: hypothetical protein KIG51_10925 [Fibrobacter sp.]|nr:hypothetical protein [Fibrobacter sp.]
MTDSKKKMDKGSKKTKKKGKSTDPKTVKRMFGVAFFAFGLFLLVALVSFIGSEKNWLGPIFGTLFPQAVVYVCLESSRQRFFLFARFAGAFGCCSPGNFRNFCALVLDFRRCPCFALRCLH